MKNLGIQVLQKIEGLLLKGSYQEALQELDFIDPSELSEMEKAHYYILCTEANLYLGNNINVSYLDKAIDLLRFHADTDKFARAKFLKGWHFTTQGNFFEAKESLLESYANYLRCNDKSGAARALNRLAFVSVYTGNVASAISNLNHCIQIYRELGDAYSESLVKHNLAYLFLISGKFNDALRTYASYPLSFGTHGDKPILNFYSMSSLPHAFKGDIKKAKDTIAQAKPYLDKYPREKAIYFENLGLISILDKDYHTAEQSLQAGLEISLKIAPESALVSQIKRLFGDLYIATKKYDLAEKYATEALAVAEKINERIEIAACWRIFARVEQHRGHTAKAREWYKKAIDLFNLNGSRYELAVTRYLYAVSDLCGYTERVALLHLAKEYFESEEVKPYIEKVEAALRETPVIRRPRRRTPAACPRVIAVSPRMTKLVEFAQHIAPSEMTVLLTGPTGSGKDLLAHYIHYHSGRRGEFVAMNAAAVPDSMIETELFGCVRGAFTGSRNRKGLLEQADGGTFYLDEIADASPEFQAKLLRVLETRCVRRLGENESRRVDFRLIVASNHDLHQRMRDNRFRLDLYHRLNEIHIALPPLDERREDIPALVRHFLTFADIDLTDGDAAAVERLGSLLRRRSWPGNVRELKHEVKRLWTVAKGRLSRMVELAEEWCPQSERERLLDALERTGWNQSEAARMLGVSEGTIRYRLKKLGLRACS
jgi:DNA-binding NtrC family response regulator/Tfp pilus assembly protein PilF